MTAPEQIRLGSPRSHRPRGVRRSAAPQPRVRAVSPARPQSAPTPDPASRALARGWRVAALFLALLLLAAAMVAGYQTVKLRQLGASPQTDPEDLPAKVAALGTTTAQLASDVAAIKAQLATSGTTGTGGVTPTPGSTTPGATGSEAFKRVTDVIPISAEQYIAALAQTKTLNSSYQKAAAASKAAPADKTLQIKSLQAEAELLRNCATVFAGATQVLYSAATPQDVMEQTATELASVAGECKVLATP